MSGAPQDLFGAIVVLALTVLIAVFMMIEGERWSKAVELRRISPDYQETRLAVERAGGADALASLRSAEQAEDSVAEMFRAIGWGFVAIGTVMFAWQLVLFVRRRNGRSHSVVDAASVAPPYRVPTRVLLFGAVLWSILGTATVTWNLLWAERQASRFFGHAGGVTSGDAAQQPSGSAAQAQLREVRDAIEGMKATAAMWGFFCFGVAAFLSVQYVRRRREALPVSPA